MTKLTLDKIKQKVHQNELFMHKEIFWCWPLNRDMNKESISDAYCAIEIEKNNYEVIRKGYFEIKKLYEDNWPDKEESKPTMPQEKKQPPFKIIDNRTFSYGERKFRLCDNVRFQINICWAMPIHPYLGLSLMKGGMFSWKCESKILTDEDDLNCENVWFTEVNDEKQPVTDCDQLEDGWIKHVGTTYKCPVEEGTLLLVRARDNFEYYFNGEICPLWKNQREGRLFLADRIAYKIIAPASERWIAWNGGDCPVEKGTKIEILLRSGIRNIDMQPQWYRWSNEKVRQDIIAYRVIYDNKEYSPTINWPNRPKYERIKAKFSEIYADFWLEYSKYVNEKDSDSRCTIDYVDMLNDKLNYLIEEFLGEDK